MPGPELRSGKLEWEVSVGRWGGWVFALAVVYTLVGYSQGFFECPPGVKSCSRGGQESSSKAFWRLRHVFV